LITSFKEAAKKSSSFFQDTSRYHACTSILFLSFTHSIQDYTNNAAGALFRPFQNTQCMECFVVNLAEEMGFEPMV
jgi:hypothetical protein